MNSKKEAPTLVALGLAGGQGKTTTILMVGRMFARLGIPVLLVDSDPQASLSRFLGVTVGQQPSTLEILTKPANEVPLKTAIRQTTEENLFTIPASRELESANSAMAASGLSLTRMRDRLYELDEEVLQEHRVANNFGLILIDAPPQRSHLALTALGCSNLLTIPAEANLKGVDSLDGTLKMILEYKRSVPHTELIGVMPFRAKWTGLNPTITARDAIAKMGAVLGREELMLPHLLESDIYPRAINAQQLPRDLGKPDLEYPFSVLMERIKPHLEDKYSRNLSVKEVAA
jgi:chromosome partitioning protein